MFMRNKPHLFILFLIIFKVSCELPSLTFVIDKSFSMKDHVEDVRKTARGIMDIFFQENMPLRNISLVTFNDTKAELRITTPSPEDLMASLISVAPANEDYNYECSESALSGVMLALESSPFESYIYVFTDAPAKDYDKSWKVERLCQKKQSQVMFVLTGDCQKPYSNRFQVYYDIATASSGLAFRAEKSEIEAVYPVINENIRETKVVVTAVTVNGDRKIPFEINEDIDYAIVSVSGINVDLEISGPSMVKRIMWTRHCKVVKLQNPGEYVAMVGSKKSASVVVAGWTNFHFLYGFSEKSPKEFGKTDQAPVLDTATHLSLYVTDQKYFLEEPSAQILSMEEDVIEQLPLKEIRPNFYITTESFRAPTKKFKIAIIGKIARTGKPVRRIAKIPVTPKQRPSVPPRITTDDSTEYEGLIGDVALRIPCEAVGFPKPTFEWKVNGSIVTSGTKYEILDGALIVKYPEQSESNFTCTATNSAGSDTKTFTGVISDAIGYGVCQNTYLLKDSSTRLTCDLPRTDSSSVKWFINGVDMGVNQSYFDLDNVQMKFNGNYTCHVSDVSGSATKTFVVFVGYPPRFKYDYEPVFHWDGQPNDYLRCDVKAEPIPHIEWTFNDQPIVGASAFQLNIFKWGFEWGHYRCNVSNVHGMVQRDFDVDN